MKAENFIKEILMGDLQASYVVVGEDFRFGHERKGTPDTSGKIWRKIRLYETIVRKRNGWQPERSAVLISVKN